jgi:hypothetical protein
MRILLTIFVAAALLAGAAVALAAGTTTQTVTGKATPSRLPQHTRAPVTLKISETTGTTDPSGVQPATASAKVFLDRDYLITTKGLPQCNIAKIAGGKSTAEAKAACGKALIGSGRTVARVSNGSGGHTDIPGVVTAFNGNPLSHTATEGCDPVKTKPCIYLHVDLGGPTVLVIVEIRRTAGPYGTVLETAPGGPEPIHSLTVKLHRSYRAGGRTKNYISARCSDGKLRVKGRFTYTSGPPLTDTSTQRCSITH